MLTALEPVDAGRAGSRLADLNGIRYWLGADGIVGKIAAHWLGSKAKPVRAILFDKNPDTNWALGWHQDRTIAVGQRADVPGFNNWNRKDGIDHVEPPFELIERMVTVRIHLDRVDDNNAPLLISPGTHRLGKIPESRLAETVERHGCIECLAEIGDVWAYRTAILHASKRALSPRRRRVLQVDYSADDLPAPLRWQMAD
ncbi:phytanoyl-CoA dioxygenase family protein [Sphingomonas sp.]|uniref:phytanoyl-CoA dioxygenase family protein n=1 Tax=Sphingomonas sp. TaxID=28214 RepID=UPI0034217230